LQFAIGFIPSVQLTVLQHQLSMFGHWRAFSLAGLMTFTALLDQLCDP